MIEAVRGYLLRLTAGAFFSAGVLALIPKGTPKKAAAVLCGLVMLLLALTPLAQLDYDALSEAFAENDNRLMVMATEQLAGRGMIVVAGAAFMSNFEVQYQVSDNGAEKRAVIATGVPPAAS